MSIYRQEVLESVLLERQQVLAQLASRMAWLLQAQTLLKELYPLGQDLVEVDRQYCKMEGFWKVCLLKGSVEGSVKGIALYVCM